MRECESESVTFQHRYENKSCSACPERLIERLKERDNESVRGRERESMIFQHRHEYKS